MSKSILFIINGFGMGNATRCDAIIDILSESYSVDVITSDKAYLYYQHNSKIKNLFKQNDLNLQKKLKYSSLRYYLNYTPHFIKRIFVNYRIQRKIINSTQYEAVVFDSDYSFILHKIFGQQKNKIAVNNAFEVVRFFTKNPLDFKFNLLSSLLLETFDFLSHYLFCDSILVPLLDFDFKKTYSVRFKKIFFIPPLVRKSLMTRSSETASEHKALVMASSSSIESGLNLFKNKQHIDFYNFLIEGFLFDNQKLLLSSQLIICNAGQSSLSECLYLNKEAIVSRIPQHAEQYANLKIVQKKGMVDLESLNLAQIDSLIESKLNNPQRPSYQCNYSLMESQIRKCFEFILQKAST